MSSSQNRDSSILYVLSFVLIGLGILLLIVAERVSSQTTLTNQLQTSLTEDGDTAEDDYSIRVIVVLSLVFISPLLITNLVDTDLFMFIGDEFGRLAFNSDGYGIGISSWSYGVSLFFGLVFGLGWTAAGRIPSQESRYYQVIRLLGGSLFGVFLCVLTALGFYWLATPYTTVEIKTLNRLGIIPGQLLQTIVVLAFARIINFSIEKIINN